MDHFLLVRSASVHESQMESDFSSECTWESDKTDSDELSVHVHEKKNSIVNKLRGWRTSSALLNLPTADSLESDDESEDRRKSETNKSSHKLGKVLKMTSKHHEKLNSLIYQKISQWKKEEPVPLSPPAVKIEWEVSSDNPLFTRKDVIFSEDEGEDEETKRE